MRLTLLWVLLITAAAAQEPSLQPPWEGVPPGFRELPIGKFKIPATRSAWEKQRISVRRIVLDCLGAMPLRPSPARVRTVSIDRKDGYRIEKFTFHNGVDSDVSGYIAIPEGRTGRLPAILTMHGHSSSKENMFGYQPTSQDVAGMLARRGYVVLGIDSYFNGERKGTGPEAASKR